MTTTHAVRPHRVLAAKPEKVYRHSRTRCQGALAAAQRLHRHRASFGRQGGRPLQDVVSQLHDWQAPFVWRRVLRAGAKGTHSLYRPNFDDPNLAGEIEVTVTLTAVSVGAELTIVHPGLPAVIALEACDLSWQESLRNLARRVEPEIAD